MLTFFRRIRKGLLGDGATSKSLLYAIGEIALVVIGILIALQINNWNEWSKDRELELKILSEIKDDLSQDLIDHNQNMDNVRGILKSSGVILEHMNSDQLYHDSLDFHFGWLPMAANFDEVRGGYELMLSKGVNIIQNDTLRSKITFLYSSQYSWLRRWLKDRQYLDRPPLLNHMIENFKVVQVYNSATPSNYNALKLNDSFEASITNHAHQYELTDRFYNEIINDVKNLILMIKLEIDRLN